MDEENGLSPPPPRYKWPWFVLAALLLGIVLAVLWMSAAVRRVREYREMNTPAPATNEPATQR